MNPPPSRSGAPDQPGGPGNEQLGGGRSNRDWVGIVANRASGTGSGRNLVDRLVNELARQGFQSQIAWTPEQRRQLVAKAERASGCHCLVAVGGDGTVSALVNERPKVPITVLPAGTENLAAQHFGLRRNPRAAARTVAAGHVVRTDVGSASGRRFILMTGFGFDGDVVTRHHRARVSRSGKVKPTHRAAYVEPILRSSLFYRFPRIHVSITDPGAEEELNGTTVFVFNLPRYALGLPFAPQAIQDDGFLDLVVFRKPGPFQALYYLWRVFRGTHLNDPGVFHRRVRRVIVSSHQTVPVQLDGDPAGFLSPDSPAQGKGEPGAAQSSSDWVIEVVPGAVDVLVPAAKAVRGATPVPLARKEIVR